MSSLGRHLSIDFTKLRHTLPILLAMQAWFVSSVAAQTVTKLTLSPTSVAGGNTSTGTVSLSKKAGSGGETVDLFSSTSAATVPASVSIAAGSKSVSFTISTSPVSANKVATIKAKLGSSGASAGLTVQAPKLISVALSPNTITGGTDATGTVLISGAAPAGGLSVSLKSNSSTLGVPKSVEVSAGSRSASFSAAASVVTKQFQPESLRRFPASPQAAAPRSFRPLSQAFRLIRPR